MFRVVICLASLAAACGWDRADPLRQLDDPNPGVRVIAATKAGEAGDPRAIVALRGRLHDPDPRVRIAIVEALATLGEGRVVADLDPMLDDADPQVRLATIGALAGIGGEPVEDPLLGALVDPDPQVRHAARQALIDGGISGAEQVRRLALRRRTSLTHLAESPSWHRRLEAARGLAECGDEAALDSLYELAGDGETQVATEAARGIGLAGDRADPERIRHLLNEGAPPVREALLAGIAEARTAPPARAICQILREARFGAAAARVVASHQLDCAPDGIAQQLEAGDQETRLRAAEVIALLRGRNVPSEITDRAANLLWSEADGERLMSAAAIPRPPPEAARARVLAGLREYRRRAERWVPLPRVEEDDEGAGELDMGELRGEGAITQLLAQFPARGRGWVELFPSGAHPGEVATLLLLAREVGLELDREVLAELAERAPHEQVRAAAAWALGGGEPYLQDRTPLVRAAAAEALVSRGDSISGRLKARLALMLTDDSPGVREAAASALASTGDPQALRPLRAAFERWPTPALGRSLIDLGQAGAAETFARTLREASPNTPEELLVVALDGLATLGASEHAEPIGRFIDHPASEVRAAAVRAARAIGDPDLAVRVEERRLDFARQVRDAASLPCES